MEIQPVNRSFYSLAIFFCTLVTAISLFESFLRFQLGATLYTLDSYINWFLTAGVTTLVMGLVQLRYYHHKQYRFAFYCALIDLLALIAFSFIIYNVLTGELTDYYIPFLVITLVTGIFYGFSLMVSPAVNRLWLRIAGAFYLTIKLVLIIAFIWTSTSSDVNRFEITEKISSRLTFIGSFVLIPIILNFWSERKEIKKEFNETQRIPSIQTVFGITGLLLFVIAILIGGKINTEKYWLVQWVNRGPENAKRLAEPFDARMFVDRKGDSLRYRLLIPLNYDSTKKYPLAVCLHGGGGRGTDNLIQIEGSWTAQLLSEQRNRENYPAFVFVPQCPPASSWGGFPGLSVYDSIVFDAIDALEKDYAIDTNRRYVMGESLGGYGSWHFITMHPELFAAAVPICGGGDPALAPSISNVAVWAFHGAKDRSVPVRMSREMITAIKNAGGNPKYTEYPNEGHIISEQVTNTPGLLDWVFEQQRAH